MVLDRPRSQSTLSPLYRLLLHRYSCTSTTPVANATLSSPGFGGGAGAPGDYNLECFEYAGCFGGRLRVAYCFWNGGHLWPSVYTPSYYNNLNDPNFVRVTSNPWGSYIIANFMLSYDAPAAPVCQHWRAV